MFITIWTVYPVKVGFKSACKYTDAKNIQVCTILACLDKMVVVATSATKLMKHSKGEWNAAEAGVTWWWKC